MHNHARLLVIRQVLRQEYGHVTAIIITYSFNSTKLLLGVDCGLILHSTVSLYFMLQNPKTITQLNVPVGRSDGL